MRPGEGEKHLVKKKCAGSVGARQRGRYLASDRRVGRNEKKKAMGSPASGKKLNGVGWNIVVDPPRCLQKRNS